jgi:hypothetical protein
MRWSFPKGVMETTRENARLGSLAVEPSIVLDEAGGESGDSVTTPDNHISPTCSSWGTPPIGGRSTAPAWPNLRLSRL